MFFVSVELLCLFVESFVIVHFEFCCYVEYAIGRESIVVVIKVQRQVCVYEIKMKETRHKISKRQTT